MCRFLIFGITTKHWKHTPRMLMNSSSVRTDRITTTRLELIKIASNPKSRSNFLGKDAPAQQLLASLFFFLEEWNLRTQARQEAIKQFTYLHLTPDLSYAVKVHRNYRTYTINNNINKTSCFLLKIYVTI